MKSLKILFVFVLVYVSVSLIYIDTEAQFTPSSRMKDSFYVGAQQSDLFHEFYKYYKQLHYNVALPGGTNEDFEKRYGLNSTSNQRWTGGFYDSLYSFPVNLPPGIVIPDTGSMLRQGYKTSLDYMLNSWLDSSNSAHSIYFRSAKIDRPAYGQRSDYQTEHNPIQLANGSIKPGYGYLHGISSYYGETWQGVHVQGRNAVVGQHQPQYIVDSLFENGEQTNVISELAGIYSDRKKIGSKYLWYVKPRMRIPVGIANNPAWADSLVARIEVYNYMGRKIDTMLIRVRNFFNTENGTEYNGAYLENYFNINQSYPLSFLADSLCNGIDTNNVYYIDPDSSKVDYRVYWYGKVDVWLDYVRLDDEWAHFLFTDPNDSLPIRINRWQFGWKIRDEVTQFANEGAFGVFYIDETYYNHIPCLVEVLRMIKHYNPDCGISIMNIPSGETGLKNIPSPEQIYAEITAKGLLTDFVASDIYPFFDDVPLPPNIIRPDTNVYHGTVLYNNAPNSQLYNQYLNDTIYEKKQRPFYQKLANVVKSSTTNTVFTMAIQSHNVESNFRLTEPCGTIPWNFERKRETTNEEISFQAYFAMCYGAKQIHHFTQMTGYYSDNCGHNYYDWGFMNGYYNGRPCNCLPRLTNYYGQQKWNYIAKLDSNLLKIGRYMYDENKLKYDNTITINKGESYSYISSLKSYFSPFGELPQNEDVKKYWEIGFFNKDLEPYSKHFLLLNKRCVPDTPVGFGDFRRAKIYFNTTALSGFNNWVLINPITNEKIIFNKNNISNGVNVPGEFQPGEGKIYKLAPVMQEGGTLVVDEIVNGVNISCKDTVLSNGKDITIEGHTAVIRFADSATIIMNGAKFYSGDDPASSSSTGQKNNFKGLNGHNWNGLRINYSEVRMYDCKFENIASPTVNFAIKMLSCPIVDIRNNQFILDTDTAGAILSSYITDEDFPFSGLYINYNSFTMNNSRTNAVQVQGFSDIILPVYIQHNSMTSNGYATGIMLSNITGGVIAYNRITGFSKGMNLMSTSADLYHNYVSNTSTQSIGILTTSGSILNMNNSGDYLTSGSDTIINTSGYSKNLDASGTIIYLSNGHNVFDLQASAPIQTYHYFGYLPSVYLLLMQSQTVLSLTEQ